jgi:Ca2+-binding RTX toxin-like protein
MPATSSFQPLEHRRLLSAALANGVLTINGTEFNDTIYISLNSADATQLHVHQSALNSNSDQDFARTSVKSIVINAGLGDDYIVVSNGNGFVVPLGILCKAGGGNDIVFGGAHNDTLFGGDGNDQLYGKSGNDQIFGEAGDDSLFADFGDDTVFGGAGQDIIGGLGGSDHLNGGSGDDRISGDDGSDWLFGNGGNDSLVGGDANDHLYGGGGDDDLDGGRGNDQLFGQAGNDDFVGRGDSAAEQLDKGLGDKGPNVLV